MAWATDGTRSAKLVASQFKSWAGRVSELTLLLSAWPQRDHLGDGGKVLSFARYQALSSSLVDVWSSRAAARPSQMPCWKLARRSRVCDADRAGVA